MVTTALVAELVVIGLQSLAWMTVLILGLFGTEWVDPAQLEAWAALVTILVIASAYGLGVIIDRLADDVFLGVDRFLRRVRGDSEGSGSVLATAAEDRPALQRMRFTVADSSDGLAKFLEYQRSRFRLARAPALNILAALPATALFLWRQATPSTGLVVFLLVVGLAGLAASVRTAIAVNGAWKGTVHEAYDIVIGAKQTADSESGGGTPGSPS
jgi:hypothetical protein